MTLLREKFGGAPCFYLLDPSSWGSTMLLPLILDWSEASVESFPPVDGYDKAAEPVASCLLKLHVTSSVRRLCDVYAKEIALCGTCVSLESLGLWARIWVRVRNGIILCIHIRYIYIYIHCKYNGWFTCLQPCM